MGNKRYQDMLTAKQTLNSNAEHWTIAFLDSIEDLVESFYLALGFNYDNYSDSSNRPLIEITKIDDKKQYPKKIEDILDSDQVAHVLLRIYLNESESNHHGGDFKIQTLIRYSEKEGAQYSVSSQQPFFWYSDKGSFTNEVFKMMEAQF
ncbi:hypothetical protein [Vibrio caribbeanicus]|uniref:Uncharacterized protein n=1 Tax=Vibrio caribbeanicus ATCC BAA-2122 TaxID=796620 RepID=E3BFH9_9VIBR|nr:hypothetical protein [Vibrio caribbeanicus]EFP98157.1 hypothetical protein VIBC2010_10222 [Vibrio caribbeanicus ATCC BAA-2122]